MLNTLLQTRREFNKPLWIARVDLKSAFDSMDRESLWLLLRRHGIPNTIVELLTEGTVHRYVQLHTDRWNAF